MASLSRYYRDAEYNFMSGSYSYKVLNKAASVINTYCIMRSFITLVILVIIIIINYYLGKDCWSAVTTIAHTSFLFYGLKLHISAVFSFAYPEA